MNIATEITEAARRIVREINTYPAETVVAFDAEGTYVDAWPAGMWFADPKDTPDHAVAVKGCKTKKMGERKAQDLLDAAAWAKEQHIVSYEVVEDGQPVTYSYVEDTNAYLNELTEARSLARYRQLGGH